MLADKDRIYTNIYGWEGADLKIREKAWRLGWYEKFDQEGARIGSLRK